METGPLFPIADGNVLTKANVVRFYRKSWRSWLNAKAALPATQPEGLERCGWLTHSSANGPYKCLVVGEALPYYAVYGKLSWAGRVALSLKRQRGSCRRTLPWRRYDHL